MLAHPSCLSRSQFVVDLIWELNQMLEIESQLSTAFHPQTDRQTERVN